MLAHREETTSWEERIYKKNSIVAAPFGGFEKISVQYMYTKYILHFVNGFPTLLQNIVYVVCTLQGLHRKVYCSGPKRTINDDICDIN